MERLVDITTPFGDAVWFRQMTGTEALSVPFEFEVVLHSKQSGLSAKAALGKDFTLKVETEKSGSVRYFNGICTRFGSAGREGDHLVYVARMRPWLWLASRRSDCKIFQFKKVPDIITEVLARYGYRRTYAGTMWLLMAGGIAGGLSDDYGLVLAARVAEGLAAGVV